MQADSMKYAAAQAAIKYVDDNTLVGIGTGSTTNFFIDLLAEIKHDIKGAVASSEASAQRLRQYDIPVFELSQCDELSVYIDGADEVDPQLNLIKGGGGALTREKILAAAARRFICIVDISKQVPILGKFPLPVEVIPMAQSFVARKLVALGGRPEWRQNFVTDNGNHILDVRGLEIAQPLKLEREINNIPGVVTVGIFAQQSPDKLIVGTDTKVIEMTNGISIS